MRHWLTVSVLLCLMLLCGQVQAAADISVGDLTCEYKTNPLGIDVRQPRLGWKIAAEARDVRQSAYAVQASFSKSDLLNSENLVWDTGKVKSGQSVHIPYTGSELHCSQRVYWRVRVWTNKGESGWSQPSFWEMGLLEAKAWQSDWIEPDLVEDDSISNPCPMLRKEFKLKDEVKWARAYVTAARSVRAAYQRRTPRGSGAHARLDLVS
ncbi:MAG: hypothetical protein U5R06_20015 [candidate division KSB1 bacterium]|nr:hypothetical protein [candidate division KSB1 bacterium]